MRDLDRVELAQRAWEEAPEEFVRDIVSHIHRAAGDGFARRLPSSAKLDLTIIPKIGVETIRDTQLSTYLTRRGMWRWRRPMVLVHTGFLHLIDDVAQIITLYDFIYADRRIGTGALPMGDIPNLVETHVRACIQRDYQWPRINPLVIRRADIVNMGAELRVRHMAISVMRFLMTFFVVAHEIGHAALGHLDAPPVAANNFWERFARVSGRENDADMFALFLLLHWIDLELDWYRSASETPDSKNSSDIELHKGYLRMLALFGLILLFDITDEIMDASFHLAGQWHLDGEHPPGSLRLYRLSEEAVFQL
ncbi:MAG: hypothetical protein L0H63_10095 [Nitrococcus sp.]|nr:hypothetical protein [Nitrococcus sp.]